MMREFTDKEILLSIGKKIRRIPEDKTLKDITNYYGEDWSFKCFMNSFFTPIEQKALGLLVGGNDDEVL